METTTFQCQICLFFVFLSLSRHLRFRISLETLVPSQDGKLRRTVICRRRASATATKDDAGSHHQDRVPHKRAISVVTVARIDVWVMQDWLSNWLISIGVCMRQGLLCFLINGSWFETPCFHYTNSVWILSCVYSWSQTTHNSVAQLRELVGRGQKTSQS